MMMMMSTTIAYVDVDVDSHVDDGLWRAMRAKCRSGSKFLYWMGLPK